MAVVDFRLANCPLCLDKGQISCLKLLQINMDEAIYSCENDKCWYPWGGEVNAASLIVARRVDDDVADKEEQTLDNDMTRLDAELARLVDAGRDADAWVSEPAYQETLEDILKFIGDTDPKGGGDVPNGPSDESSDALS